MKQHKQTQGLEIILLQQTRAMTQKQNENVYANTNLTQYLVYIFKVLLITGILSQFRIHQFFKRILPCIS